MCETFRAPHPNGRSAPSLLAESPKTCHSGCADSEAQEEQGALRLTDGVGSPFKPLYSGIVEIFKAGRWVAVCRNRGDDAITADVVCRRLGFPQGTPVNGRVADADYDMPEESEAPSDTTWLAGMSCRGPEVTLTDCLNNNDNSFLDDMGGEFADTSIPTSV